MLGGIDGRSASRGGGGWKEADGAAECIREISCGRIAFARKFRHALQANAFQLGREIRSNLARRLRLVLANLPENVHVVSPAKRGPPTQDRVKCCRQTVNIGPTVGTVARPPACSGDIYDGVPETIPSSADASMSESASPKSTSTGRWPSAKTMFAGLISRCTML